VNSSDIYTWPNKSFTFQLSEVDANAMRLLFGLPPVSTEPAIQRTPVEGGQIRATNKIAGVQFGWFSCLGTTTVFDYRGRLIDAYVVEAWNNGIVETWPVVTDKFDYEFRAKPPADEPLVKSDVAPFDSGTADKIEFLSRVSDEMAAQIEKWGQQDHPMTSAPWAWVEHGTYLALATKYKKLNDTRAAEGKQTWDLIFLEEVFEALAERDPELAVAELVQAAAVAASAALSVQRNGLRGKARAA
jgi:hypothetical protein